MKAVIILVAAVFALSSCSKSIDAVSEALTPGNNYGQFVKYTIQKGNHYCTGNVFKQIELSEMKFAVRFDSSAIYKTVSAENQYDINKLYGFSDNGGDHHQHSARFGWRWSANALRLFAYVYNNGTVTSKELTTIPIGTETSCSIKVTSTNYIFTVNDVVYQLPRTAGTQKAKGYQLYPYFGGDEVAPHDIHIWLKNLE
jgi:hypothetical protein